jgi:flavin-dependent dehydrogenase
MTNKAVPTVGLTGRDRAIVMGGSIAGLAAARVLSDHFRQVILVERDQFSAVREHRRGVPQGRHTRPFSRWPEDSRRLFPWTLPGGTKSRRTGSGSYARCVLVF